MTGPGNFYRDTKQPLKKQASEAAACIWGVGTMKRDGVVGPGTNNVKANAAAQSFNSADLTSLNGSGDKLCHGFAAIINLRLEFLRLSEGRQCWGSKKAHDLTARIDAEAVALKALGWKPSDEPVVLGTSRNLKQTPSPKVA